MEAKSIVKEAVAKRVPALRELHQRIWESAELGYEEIKSALALRDFMASEGFAVETGVAGIPTAFVASYGSGKPIIGILAEYDALSQLSQQPGCPTKDPIPGQEGGHGCGHSALGTGSAAAAVAIKDYLEATGKSGTVKLYGCPAEENGWGKTFMARAGLFDELDCAFTWHPSYDNGVWSTSSLANVSVKFKFAGRTAHAAAAPHAGRSALDSCEIMNVGVNYLREHVIPEARMHYAYLDVGGTSPNVVQDHACVHYFLRAPKSAQVQEILARVKDIAKGAALICGTECICEIQSGMSDYIPNPTMSAVIQESLTELGAPEFDGADQALATQFFQSLPEESRQQVLAGLARRFGEERAREIAAAPLEETISPLVLTKVAMPGSTDVGDVSYVTPTAQATLAGFCIGTTPHTWQVTGQIGSSIGEKCYLKAGEVLALSAAKVIDQPELCQQAREELLAETGGVYDCPAPDDVLPPIPEGVAQRAKEAGL
ncbi:amidohydrolase [Bittarella massiliensis (ex Durand et al. 2017)]|uniref:amidohydrolase n=1 Tax=Bittarella massiliensis (ex Durand et al. 2017) TaxID=1720313 RepID=UPI001AA0F328|nr:amidohydrolase [Bittarella massiliensis (ex Durand et al. 2017)]MBO1678977.1 amidohydrolase [Bittarella massiliensis (ex Durand et al. 2017)]